MQTELVTIYTGMQDPVLRYIRSKVSDRADAEDIMQNIFIKVAANLTGNNRPEKLQNWIFTVTRNAINDYYRKKNPAVEFTAESDASPEDEAYQSAASDLDCCLMKFLQALPEEYREILIDVELNGIRQKDLVEKYNLAYPSIRSRVQRGREKLKQALLGCCTIQCDVRGNILEVQQKKCG